MLYFLVVNFWSKNLIKHMLVTDEFIQHQPKVVVVNNSPDEIINKKTVQYFNLIVLEPGTNLGFGAGCNLGLNYIYQQSPEARVWLLNPDARLLPGAVSYIKTCFDQFSNLAILGTRIKDAEGKPWFDMGQFNPWLGTLSHRACIPIKTKTTPDILTSRWVTGCSLILNFAQFRQVPLFDPTYFLYYEDNDLCENYYRQGYKIAVTQAILVIHSVSSTANQNLGLKWRYATFSKLYFLQKYATLLAVWLNIAYLLWKIWLDTLRGDWYIAQGRLEGLRQFIGLQNTCHSTFKASKAERSHPPP